MNDFKLNEGEKISPGFTTPDGYFENFTERLMQQLPQPEIKVVPLYKRKPVWLSAAAAFMVMLTLGIFFTTATGTTTKQPDQAAIENYLVYQTNLSSYDLIQHLDDEDIKELEQQIVINDDAIEDYLDDQNIYTTY
jgi:hypothetical protein